jgi:hypothetical protein
MLTRRDFIAELAITSAAVATMSTAPTGIFAAVPAARGPVVSIHMDQPYLDTTGRALPYVPPNGLRAGAPIDKLSEAEFRRRFAYL